MNPVIRLAPVVSASRFGAYRELTIEAPEMAAGARPGQFLNICIQPGGAHLLRRPFSPARADRDGGTVSTVFDPVGLGSQWLGARGKADNGGVVGPPAPGVNVTADPRDDLL